jgi:serine/threonine protein kinase
MSLLTLNIYHFLYPDQVRLAVEKTLPLEEREKASAYSKILIDKVNTYFMNVSVGEKRFSKKSIDGGSLPFTFWATKRLDGFYLHFIPNTSSVKSWIGGFKKVKESFFLKVLKTDPRESPISPISTVCYRVNENKFHMVQKGLVTQQRIMGLFENSSLFPKIPISHSLFIGSRGIRKGEMVTRRYKGDLERLCQKAEIIGLVPKLLCCLDITRTIGLFRAATPPILHGDIKPNNFLVTEENKALLSDFDFTTFLEERVKKANPFSNPRYRSFMERRGLLSLEGDLYALVVSIGEILILGFDFLNSSNFFRKSLIGSLQNRHLLIRQPYNSWKREVDSSLQQEIESIFYDNDFNPAEVSRGLLDYGKSLDRPDILPGIKRLSSQLAVFEPIFELLLRTFKIDEKSQNDFLKGKDFRQIFEEQHFPDTEEIKRVLEECQMNLDRIENPNIALDTVSQAEKRSDTQILYRDQVSDLVRQVYPKNLEYTPYCSEIFVENVNACLKSNKQEEFEFRFIKNEFWGASSEVPFSGMIRKDKEGIYLYVIPRSEDTPVQRDSYLMVKSIWYSHIPRDSTPNAKAPVQKALCTRIKRNRFGIIGDWTKILESFRHNTQLDRFLACIPGHASVFNCRDGLNLELYDKEHQSTLEMELNKLTLKQKLDVYLNVLDSIDVLHQENLVHRNIKPANVFLSYKEGEGIRAKLTDFTYTHPPGMTELKAPNYGIWNYGSKNGYTSRETDIFSLIMIIKISLWEEPFALLESEIENVPESLRDKIVQTWHDFGGFTKEFFAALPSLGNSKEEFLILDGILLESKKVVPLLYLIDEVEEIDQEIEAFVQRNGGFSESAIKRAFETHPYPLLSRVREVLNGVMRENVEPKASKKRPLDKLLKDTL